MSTHKTQVSGLRHTIDIPQKPILELDPRLFWIQTLHVKVDDHRDEVLRLIGFFSECFD
jgi:hypothetical protein